MKTTVEIADSLFTAAKRRAAEDRRPLRAVIEDALRSYLGAATVGVPETPRRIAWVTADGGVPEGVDVADREALGEWMRGERERSAR